MNFTPVDNNGLVDGFCLIKSIDIKTSSKGDTYLDITLGDNDGEINAKLWRYSKEVHGEYEANQIVKVRGTISQYNGSDQLRIEKIRLSLPGDGVKIDDFVQSADYTGEQMYNELIAIVDSFEDEDLKTLVKKIYEDNRLSILYWPAAFKLHHALRGGLLMHVLSIVRLAQSICEIYPFVDRDLLISGAMLHDVSKLEEFEVGELGIASGYSVEGNLIGHLAMGAMKIRKYAEELGINKKIAMLVEHMILSHHGEPEFGAAVRPMFIEAEILSELDLLDSRIFEMKEAVSSTKPDDFSGRLWALDNRKLYNHGRMNLDEKVKLL